MSDKPGKTPAPGGRSGKSTDATATTVSQRVLSQEGFALESTQRMQRRLQQDADQRLGRRVTSAGESPAPGAPAPQPQPAPTPTKTHIKHDSRGNAVWNWAASVGAAALESTSRLLKRLENPELSIDDKPKELELEERKTGGGYDPYNGGKRGRG
jgi:hypothetical protein